MRPAEAEVGQGEATRLPPIVTTGRATTPFSVPGTPSGFSALSTASELKQHCVELVEMEHPQLPGESAADWEARFRRAVVAEMRSQMRAR